MRPLSGHLNFLKYINANIFWKSSLKIIVRTSILYVVIVSFHNGRPLSGHLISVSVIAFDKCNNYMSGQIRAIEYRTCCFH